MEELEGYLQCFDEKDRVLVKQYVHERMEFLQRYEEIQDKTQDVFEIVLSLTFGSKKFGTCHKLIDMRPKRLLRSRIAYCGFDDMMRIVVDRGVDFFEIVGSDKPKLEQFLQSRDCARKAAIVVMSLFSDGRGAAVGRNRKDVGRIIGRAIWASRGIKEWMN